MALIRILILLVLLMIGLQDIKSRSVYWVLFPTLTVLLVSTFFLQHVKLSERLPSALINLAFLGLQLLLLSAYFSFRQRQWINVISTMLGWGDVLFLVSICFYLSVFNFLIFYTGSIIVVLVGWAIYQIFSKSKKIPLAGLQAFIFILFLTSDWWLLHIDMTSDHWLLKFFP